MKRIIAIILLMLTGCSATSKMNFGNQIPIAVDNVSRIQKGITTKTEIVEFFGTPTFGMYPLAYIPEEHNLLVYKNCEVVSKATAWSGQVKMDTFLKPLFS